MSTPHQRILADSGSQELATLAIETARKKNSFCLIRALSHQVNLIGSISFLGENLLIKKKLLWVRLYLFFLPIVSTHHSGLNREFMSFVSS